MTSAPHERTDLPGTLGAEYARADEHRPLGGYAAGLHRPAAKQPPMRGVFVLYLTLIVAGIVFYAVIGLAHN